jgi:hypothetical protein
MVDRERSHLHQPCCLPVSPASGLTWPCSAVIRENTEQADRAVADHHDGRSRFHVRRVGQAFCCSDFPSQSFTMT